MIAKGDSVSHYEILGELGRGGMGVVYKAADSKLNRTVALKVLPPHALASSDDRSRFYREARAAAALHHPHIATVFEIDEDEGSPFIAMEFVDGQPLDDRIAAGPLPLRDAVTIASQIAEGLKAAHAKNIVHRDIKSANIMLSQDGQAKILDFGLAKTAASTKLTQMGSTLGTVAYMSPEQARGDDVDHRTDLWSLGAVLYEMIAGKLPFPGDFEQAVVYSILHEDPQPLTAVRTGVPMGLEWIVTKLLAKDPDERYQNAADLLVDLKTVDLTKPGMSRIRPGSLAGSGVEGSRTVPAAPVAPATLKRSTPLLGAAFLFGAALVAAAWLLWPRAVPYVETSVKRFTFEIPHTHALGGLDISPDGSKIAYANASVSENNLFVLDLTTGQTRSVEGASGAIEVEVSPDGQWLLITKQLSIERVSLFGGSPLLVAETTEGVPRANWGPDGWVLYEDRQTIWKANLNTRETFQLTNIDSLADEVDQDWPSLLPDGRTVMATIEFGHAPSAIGFWDFETGERKGQISMDGYRATYVEPGYLMFVLGANSGNLVALPFDLPSLTATGSPIPVAGNVESRTFSVSRGGTLVTTGPQGLNLFGDLPASQLSIVNFPSVVQPLDFEPDYYTDFQLSDDGKKLVVEKRVYEVHERGRIVGGGVDVWVLDIDSGGEVRLTFNNSGGDPTWWPGTDSVAYIDLSRLSTLGSVVELRSADGSGEARELFRSKVRLMDLAVSPDKRKIAYAIGGDNETDGFTRLVVRDLQTGQTADLSRGESASFRHPDFSPDGRYVAYERGERIWSSPVDASGIPIYVGQARNPKWSKDGTELYLTNFSTIHIEAVKLQPQFSLQARSGSGTGFGEFTNFDVFPDGQSFIIDRQVPDFPTPGQVAPDSSVTVGVIVNWFETLK